MVKLDERRNIETVDSFPGLLLAVVYVFFFVLFCLFFLHTASDQKLEPRKEANNYI